MTIRYCGESQNIAIRTEELSNLKNIKYWLTLKVSFKLQNFIIIILLIECVIEFNCILFKKYISISKHRHIICLFYVNLLCRPTSQELEILSDNQY